MKTDPRFLVSISEGLGDEINFSVQNPKLNASSERVSSIYDTFKAERIREWITRGACIFLGMALGSLGSEVTRLIVAKVTEAAFPVYLGFALSAFTVSSALSMWSICDKFGICKRGTCES